MKSASNKPLVYLLLGGIAVCLALLPWSRFLGIGLPDETLLTERAAQYAKLRQADDWVGIYALMDARDREVVSQRKFMMLYGLGALKVIEIKEKSRALDTEKGIAVVEMALEAQMQLDRLPEHVRRALRTPDPKDLRHASDFTTEWSWSDGNWWLRMEREALTGRTSDGKEIVPTNGVK